MVIDTSALVSILLNEADADQMRRAIAEASSRAINAANFAEALIVASVKLGPAGREAMDRLVREAEIEIVGCDETLAEFACDAFERFGKGRHPARLNLGDCYAFALASARRQPLLYKGDDFAKTDIPSALA